MKNVVWNIMWFYLAHSCYIVICPSLPILINNIHFTFEYIFYPVAVPFCIFTSQTLCWVTDRKRETESDSEEERWKRVNDLVNEWFVYFHYLRPDWFSLPAIHKHMHNNIEKKCLVVPRWPVNFINAGTSKFILLKQNQMI